MNRFIAYRHTGADPDRLNLILPAARDAFSERGEETYCTFFDEENFKSSSYTPRQIMDHAFAKIEEMGSLFIILDTEDKSEGMIMEVGFCIAKGIKMAIAKKKGINNTYLPDMADLSYEYDSIEDFKKGIASMPVSF